MNAVSVISISEQELVLEWLSSASNDMIADSALALLSGIDTNFATIKSEFTVVSPDTWSCAQHEYDFLVTSRTHDHAHETHHPHSDTLELTPPAATNTGSSDTAAAASSSSTRRQSLAQNVDRLCMFLAAHFGTVSEVLLDEVPGREDDLLMLHVNVDGLVASIDLMTMVRPFCFGVLKKKKTQALIVSHHLAK